MEQGVTVHELAQPIRCPLCDQPTARMVQRCDGLRIDDPTCEACDGAGDRKRPRRPRKIAPRPQAPGGVRKRRRR